MHCSASKILAPSVDIFGGKLFYTKFQAKLLQIQNFARCAIAHHHHIPLSHLSLRTLPHSHLSPSLSFTPCPSQTVTLSLSNSDSETSHPKRRRGPQAPLPCLQQIVAAPPAARSDRARVSVIVLQFFARLRRANFYAFTLLGLFLHMYTFTLLRSHRQTFTQHGGRYRVHRRIDGGFAKVRKSSRGINGDIR